MSVRTADLLQNDVPFVASTDSAKWREADPRKPSLAGVNHGRVHPSPSQKLAADVFRIGFIVPKNACLNWSIAGMRRWKTTLTG